MKTLITSILIFAALQVNAQLTFDTSKPVDTLIADFVGSGVTISNVTFTGGPQSIASFNGSSSLGSSQGIVFTSGTIDSLMATSAISFLSGSLSLPGDADLNAIVGGGLTYDASVLEFDFVATNNTLLFDYVFASEEYNEYAGSSFNDVFAFFISGPGIAGSQNIALIPSTTTPVSINNVNNGSSGAGPCVNCAYYHDNTNDTSVAFDGFTVPLTATYTLTPGLTYHFKLAVADVADGIFDTGVFLQKYSLRSVSATSVAENTLEKTSVYFSGDLLTIKSPSTIEMDIAIYNLSGAKIYESKKMNSGSNILLQMPAGIYSVVINSDGLTSVKKVVKQ